MARKKDSEPSVPAASRQAYDGIVALIDPFCREHLNSEYQNLCHKLAAALARKRPSPIVRGKPEVWAAAIIRVIGWVNFLDDSSRSPHVRMTDVDAAFGISSSTGQTKSKAIRDLLKIRQFDHHWTLPSRLATTSTIWMVQVHGFPIDVRRAPREVQALAFEKGLIPYIPADRAAESQADQGEEEAT